MIVETIWEALLSEHERLALEPGVPVSLPRRPDVLVIGGGIVGIAIAYFLAGRKAGQIVLVEQGALASGATRANAGGIFPGQQGAHLPPAFRALGLASTRLYTELSEEDWAHFDWRQSGSLAVSAERFACPMSEYAAQEKAAGRIVEYLTGSAVRELEPALSPDIAEGIYYPQDGRLNPLRTTLSFAAAARDLGATFATGVRVEGFETDSGRIQRVKTTAGDFDPGTVVLATGWSAPQLAEALGLSLPVEPVKGQMLATEPADFELRAAVNSTQAMMQLPSGEIIAGGTVEYLGEDYEPTQPIMDKIVTEARRVIPALREVPFVRAWAGLRPHTPDDLPVIDRAPGFDNLFLATGHFKNGVLLAPITGQLLAEWLIDGKPAMDLSALCYERFQGG